MLANIFIGLTIIGITILIHALGTTVLVNYLQNFYSLSDHKVRLIWILRVVILTAFFLMILHIIEITIWAIIFLVLPGITEIKLFEEAIYFSIVTYTTLGYGDITLGPAWRLLSGFEAINGVLLIGWSTALFFAILQNIFKLKGQDKKITD